MCVYIYVYIYIEKYGKQWNVISYETAWMQPQASKNSSSDSGKNTDVSMIWVNYQKSLT